MFRRDLGLFAKCLTSALVSFAVLLLITAVLAFALISSGEEAYIKPTVALINNEGSEMSEFVIDVVKNIDYISESMTITEMTESEAMEALEEGYCSAVIVLPDGFTGDVLHGREAQGKIIISDSISAQSEIVREIAKIGETLLGAGQYGVFSGEQLISDYSLESEHDGFLTTSNIRLLSEAFGAGRRYLERETTGYADTGMSRAAYYSLCWTVALLFLASLIFGELFTTDTSRPMLSRLYACGVTKFGFMKWKMVFTFGFRLILAAIVLVLMDAFELADISLASAIYVPIAVAYITLISACLSLCSGDGLTAHAISAVGGLLLCGGIVPRQIMPYFLCRIGDFTPFGAAKAIMAPAFGGPVDWLCSAAAACYSVLAVFAIYVKLRRIQEGRTAV